MTLKVVQDTSTNWTAAQWRIIDRLKKVLAEGDNRSGRPWTIGALVDELAPLLDPRLAEDGLRRRSGGSNGGALPSRDPITVRDLALEVGESPKYLMDKANVFIAWPPESRVPGVNYTVFERLTGAPDRKQILAKLLKVKEAFDITKDDVNRAMGNSYVDSPIGIAEMAAGYRARLAKFRGTRLTVKARVELEQLRLEIDVLLGEAEAEVG